MKTASVALTAHLESGCTTTCTLWKLTRTDGTVLGFTDHDQDLTFGGVTYSAASGYTRTALASGSDLAVDNMDLDGLLNSGAITADDVRAGLYDWAELLVQLVNWSDLSQGSVILRRGWLGEFTLRDGVFTTELRGLSQALTRRFVEATTPDCRADLGDSRCKVSLAALTETGTVTEVSTARRVFVATISGARAAGFFNGGLLTWSTGANTGAKMEVKSVSGSSVTLYLPAGEDIAEGDTFSIRAGCDKSIGTCKAKFDNILNFRGEPYVPGLDAITRTPNARVE
jgi:uncharacterized phage protein (TIGR02218 family)